MSRTRITVTLVTVVLLLVGATLLVTSRSSRSERPDAAAPAPGSQTHGSRGSTSHPSELQATTGDQKNAPPKVPGKRGAETQQPPANGRLVLPTHKGPLLAAPIPRPTSSRGRLTSGYPHAVLPVFPGSSVRSSSVSPSGSAAQVALVGETSRRQDTVAKFYRLRLARYGFQESELPAVGGSTAIGFHRGKDSVVLTLTPHGTKVLAYSVFGVLHAGTA